MQRVVFPVGNHFWPPGRTVFPVPSLVVDKRFHAAVVSFLLDDRWSLPCCCGSLFAFMLVQFSLFIVLVLLVSPRGPSQKLEYVCPYVKCIVDAHVLDYLSSVSSSFLSDVAVSFVSGVLVGIEDQSKGGVLIVLVSACLCDSSPPCDSRLLL